VTPRDAVRRRDRGEPCAPSGVGRAACRPRRRIAATVGLLLALGVTGVPCRAASRSATRADLPPGLRPTWRVDFAGYQQADGAMTIERDGDEVDPYFAFKALFVARSRGADDDGALDRFVDWLLPRAAVDGRIDRYSKRQGAWAATRGADADDIALALWIRGLLTRGEGRALGRDELRALGRARDYLELRLLDRGRGVYRPLAGDNDPLLMDNVEILESLRAIEALLARRGDAHAAAYWRLRADSLQAAIERDFEGVDTLNPATGADAPPDATGEPAFYPDIVAAPFAWLHGVPRHRAPARFDAWLARYGAAWRRNAEHDYPWGLIALVALDEGRGDVADDWRRAQDRQRQAGLWNVLEETAWQALSPAALAARRSG